MPERVEVASAEAAQLLEPPAPRRTGWRDDIQALRAVAVIAVVIYHLWPGTLRGGFVGVDIFLVVSGFVVGGPLLERAYRGERLNVKTFFARRALRLGPASLTVVLATLIASALTYAPVDQLLWSGGLRLVSMAKDAIAAAANISNLWLMWQQRDYADDGFGSPYTHFWSLGVEWQFYAIAPLIVIALAALARHDRRLRPLGIIALLVLAFNLAALAPEVWNGAFFNPLARVWEFIVGMASAFVFARLGGARRWAPWLAALGWLMIAVGVLVSRFSPAWPNAWTLIPVLGAAAVLVGGPGHRGLARVVRARPVQAVGNASYAIYLVHWPLLILVTGGSRSLGIAAQVALCAAIALCAAALHVFVERPALRLRSMTRVTAGHLLCWWAAATTAIIVLAVGTGVLAQHQASAADAIAPVYAPIALTDTEWTHESVVPANLRPGLTEARSDLPQIDTSTCGEPVEKPGAGQHTCIYGSNQESAPTMVLFGDSHAQQWIPALRAIVDERGWRLVVITGSGCGPWVGLHIERRGEACDAWRKWALQTLASSDADVVVASGWYGYSTDEGEPTSDSRFANGVADIAGATPTGARLVWIGDTPEWTSDPVSCLSEHAYAAQLCATSVGRAHARIGAVVRASVENHGGSWVSFTDYLCTAKCPALIDDVLVYRDDDHLTATFAAELRRPLGDLLDLPGS